MPKKPSLARSGAQRNKPKAQKSFELVRPVSQAEEVQPVEIEPINATVQDNSVSSEIKAETTIAKTDTTDRENIATLPAVPKKRERSTTVVTESPVAKKTSTPTREESVKATSVASAPEASTSAKGSVSTRRAAYRQGTSKASQRNAVALISAANYAYVTKDLVIIAILAIIMFAAIIILYFVPGIGS